MAGTNGKQKALCSTAIYWLGVWRPKWGKREVRRQESGDRMGTEGVKTFCMRVPGLSKMCASPCGSRGRGREKRAASRSSPCCPWSGCRGKREWEVWDGKSKTVCSETVQNMQDGCPKWVGRMSRMADAVPVFPLPYYERILRKAVQNMQDRCPK